MEKLINYETLFNDPQAKKLFSRTFQHPDLKEKIDFVSTLWLLSLANPHPTLKTDLGNWGNPDELVDFTSLYQNIEEFGMRDPFIIGVGKHTRRIRLEAGNHRVHTMLCHGIPYVPAVAYIGETSITHLGNGHHEGHEVELNLPISTGVLGPYSEKIYARPSDIIPSCPGFHFEGWH